ncbi:hypothetical protein GQ457_12G030840 [Hibiscus cannabinus]
MVQVRRAHNESTATRPHAHSNVSRRYIGRDAAGRHASLVPPPPQHLSEPHNVADFAAFSKSGRHFFRCTLKASERKTKPLL